MISGKRFALIALDRKGNIEAWIIATDVDDLIEQCQKRHASLDLKAKLEQSAQWVYANSYALNSGAQYDIPSGLRLLVDRDPT
jgi:hypothetical protein